MIFLRYIIVEVIYGKIESRKYSSLIKKGIQNVVIQRAQVLGCLFHVGFLTYMSSLME